MLHVRWCSVAAGRLMPLLCRTVVPFGGSFEETDDDARADLRPASMIAAPPRTPQTALLQDAADEQESKQKN